MLLSWSSIQTLFYMTLKFDIIQNFSTSHTILLGTLIHACVLLLGYIYIFESTYYMVHKTNKPLLFSPKCRSEYSVCGNDVEYCAILISQIWQQSTLRNMYCFKWSYLLMHESVQPRLVANDHDG